MRVSQWKPAESQDRRPGSLKRFREVEHEAVATTTCRRPDARSSK
ncbi:MAG: hypothetical protein AAF752_11980 [Bacteroidota bacterium]